MKSLLITAVIATFVLALFLHSGNALICYNCPFENCDKNMTCKNDEDACLIIYHGTRNISRCWKYPQCDALILSRTFSIHNFKYMCCQWNLCNNAPTIVTSKIILIGAFLPTIAHMLKFLVWN